MSKHTPGPWTLSEGNTSIWGNGPLCSHIRLANVLTHAPSNGIDHVAIAKLMVAAPEMLDQLNNIEKWLLGRQGELNENEHMALRATQKIIAKAEGKS